LIKDNLKDYDYVLWVDVDSVIVNPDYKLEDIVKTEKNFYISNTINYVNCGIMMFKSSDWSYKFLTDVWDNRDNKEIKRIDIWWEQAIIQEFLLSGKYSHYKNVGFVKQSLFNAMIYDFYGITSDDGQLDRNSFIFHLAGFNGRPNDVIDNFERVFKIYNLKWWV
jgi:hypothetical protein